MLWRFSEWRYGRDGFSYFQLVFWSRPSGKKHITMINYEKSQFSMGKLIINGYKWPMFNSYAAMSNSQRVTQKYPKNEWLLPKRRCPRGGLLMCPSLETCRCTKNWWDWHRIAMNSVGILSSLEGDSTQKIMFVWCVSVNATFPVSLLDISKPHRRYCVPVGSLAQQKAYYCFG